MARVDQPITYTQWADEKGYPTQYFYQFILDLWRRTGGSTDIDLTSIVQNIALSSDSGSGVAERTTFQHETSANYTVSGSYDIETVICTNTSNITITLPTVVEGQEVIVNRKGTGGVTISGSILGESSQVIPLQYDSAHLLALSSDWGVI